MVEDTMVEETAVEETVNLNIRMTAARRPLPTLRVCSP